MDIKNNATFIISFYKVDEKDFDYWKDTYLKLKLAGYNFHFILDGLTSDDVFLFKSFVEVGDLFIVEKNSGRAMNTYNHIKDGNVSTKFIKNLDPDDRIILKNLDTFVLEEGINITKIFVYNDLNDESKGYSLFFRKIYGTPMTFLPTDGLYFDKFYLEHKSKRVDIGEDILLATICVLNGFDTILNSSEPFYIYKFENGISNVSNLHNELKVYLSSVNLFDVYFDLVTSSLIIPDMVFPARMIERIENSNLNFEFNDRNSDYFDNNKREIWLQLKGIINKFKDHFYFDDEYKTKFK